MDEPSATCVTLPLEEFLATADTAPAPEAAEKKKKKEKKAPAPARLVKMDSYFDTLTKSTGAWQRYADYARESAEGVPMCYFARAEPVKGFGACDKDEYLLAPVGFCFAHEDCADMQGLIARKDALLHNYFHNTKEGFFQGCDRGESFLICEACVNLPDGLARLALVAQKYKEAFLAKHKTRTPLRVLIDPDFIHGPRVFGRGSSCKLCKHRNALLEIRKELRARREAKSAAHAAVSTSE